MSFDNFNKGKEVVSRPAHHTAVPRPLSTNNPSSNKQQSRSAMNSPPNVSDNTPRTIRRPVPEHLDASQKTPLSHKRSGGNSSRHSVPSSGSSRFRVSTAASGPNSKPNAAAVNNNTEGSSSPLGPLFNDEDDYHGENSIGEEQFNGHSGENVTSTTLGVEPIRRRLNNEGAEQASTKHSHATMIGEEEYIVQVRRPMEILDTEWN